MTRGLFLVLLAANALCAAWILLSPRESAEGVGHRPAAPAYAAKLELASEYSPAPATMAQDPVETPSGEPAVAAAAAAAATAVTDAVATPGSTPDATAPEITAAAPGAVAEARAVQAVASAQQCVRIGPLRDAAAGERLRQRVRQWLPATRLEEGEVPDRSSYWVHVPPRASEEEAKAVVRALTAQRIESFVIRDEPALLHGVSLGVFRDAESAQELHARLQGTGYPVAIHEKSRTRRAFFLVGASGADADPAVAPALDEAVAAAAPEARVAPAGCAGIAPAPASD